MKGCCACGGTGVFLASYSWFIQDGYRRVACYFCNPATGKILCSPDPETVRWQKQKRERIAKWGGLTPRPEHLDERGIILAEFR